ncbi:MAG: tetratricopeptide repeat protein [Deltaproteobacteria bacterium]|nr:tetratricopeptide repeat protein [Deltaproteobacteria bacterium]
MLRAALLGLVLASSSLAHADTAESLFAEGRALLSQHKPAEACAKFEAAIAMDPQAPGVLLNLGLCNEDQHKLASALTWFRKAQTLAAEKGLPEVDDAARAKMRALATQVPTVRIDVPSGIAVTVDGVPLDATARVHVELDAGHHTVVLHGKGVYEGPQDVEVADDAHERPLALQLEPPKEPSHRKRNGKILIGIGGGLLLADAVLGVYAKHEFDSTHDLATRQHWKNVLHVGGSAVFVVGAVALGAGSYLYVTAGETQAGVAVAGRF